MNQILTRLPVKSLVRFKLVSKLWCCSIQDPYFVDLHYSHSIHHRSRFLISFPCSKETPFITPSHTVSADHEGETLHLLDFPNYAIYSCYHGLIVYLSVDINDVIVCNPNTKETLTLPKLRSPQIQRSGRYRFKSFFEIGHDTSTKEHKVLHISLATQHFTDNEEDSDEEDYMFEYFYIECHIITLCKSNANYNSGWRKLDQLPPYLLHHRYKAYTNGAIHWRNMEQPTHLRNVDQALDDGPPREDVIVAFDFADEKFSVIHLPDFIFSSSKTRYNCLLQAMEGHVALVDLDRLRDYNTVDLWILEDYAKQTWIRKTFQLSLDMLQDKCRPIGTIATGEVIMLTIEFTRQFWLYYYDLTKKTSRKVEFTSLSSQEFCCGCRSGFFVAVKHFVESLYSWNGRNS